MFSVQNLHLHCIFSRGGLLSNGSQQSLLKVLSCKLLSGMESDNRLCKTHHLAQFVIGFGVLHPTMICDELKAPAHHQSIESSRRSKNGSPGGTGVSWTPSPQPARHAPPLSSRPPVVARLAAGCTEPAR